MSKAEHQPSYGEVVEAVRRAIVIVKEGSVSAESITEDTALYAYDDSVDHSLDLDSLDALDIIASLEKALDLELSDDVDLESIHTVGDVARALGTRRHP